jgi:hypothetical protein
LNLRIGILFDGREIIFVLIFVAIFNYVTVRIKSWGITLDDISVITRVLDPLPGVSCEKAL